MRRLVWWISVGLGASLAAGCPETATGAGAGETCFRTSQCADGLACIEGQCTTDLGPLLEAGTPVMLPDAGMMMMVDGGGVDAGPPPPRDSGPPPPRDSGPPPPTDAGPPPPMDAGPPPPMDAGPPPTDAGAGG